ncbi:MAG TPA: transcriptional regulator [Saprospiraceae bacterium]|nr:transcriptional regulator [Saprospiraceae bacterium]
MDFTHCKSKFIELWAQLCHHWGVNKSMAQIHALLLASPVELNMEQIMSELSLSQGCVNMNVRSLIDWNLIHKRQKPEERCDYYYAEKDMQQVLKHILIQRKKLELEPLVAQLNELKECKEMGEEHHDFKQTVVQIHQLATRVDYALETLTRTDSHWFFNTIMKVIQ